MKEEERFQRLHLTYAPQNGRMGAGMTKTKRIRNLLTGFLLAVCLILESGLPVLAGEQAPKDFPNSGVAAILDPGATNTAEIINAKAKELNLTPAVARERSTLVMASVKTALNVRSEASEDAEKVGKLYRDCGGTLIEQKDGWTKLRSGNMIGWAKDEFLLFGEEAKALANDVGKMVATINTEALRIRMEPNLEASVYGVLPKGEITEVVEIRDDGWVCIDYEGKDGFVSAEYVNVDFRIDSGETIAEIKAREAAELEKKRHVNYGQYTADADTALLLAALIQCEAGGESYEGQLAVGAVVMNRVRSGAYPDSIHGVIYASGQFTPAMSGKVNRVYESGKIFASCIQAAQDAISGSSNVGDLTHFRRNNGRSGLVIGNHVFY